MTTLRRQLSTSLRPLLPALFDGPPIVEARSDCRDCAMLSPSGCAGGLLPPFHNATRCCTFWPTLPGYLVGELLADPAPELAEASARLRTLIAHREGVEPQWLRPGARWSALYEVLGDELFGRSELIRCPYHLPEEGLCALRRRWESTCATWRCMYQARAVGQRAWTRLDAYLGALEGEVSDRVLARVAPELRARRGKESGLDPRPYEARWGAWAGREEALYVACHEALRAWPVDALAAEVAAPTAAALAAFEEAYRQALDPRCPPDAVPAADYAVVAEEGERLMVFTCNLHDPVEVPSSALQALERGEDLGPWRDALWLAGLLVPRAL